MYFPVTFHMLPSSTRVIYSKLITGMTELRECFSKIVRPPFADSSAGLSFIQSIESINLLLFSIYLQVNHSLKANVRSEPPLVMLAY